MSIKCVVILDLIYEKSKKDINTSVLCQRLNASNLIASSYFLCARIMI